MEAINLRIGIVDCPVESDTQTGVLVGQGLVEVLLVVDILGGLVRPEAQGAASTLHDDVWTEAAEDAGLVVLTGVEIGNDGIVWVVELGVAGRAGGTSRGLGACDAKSMGAVEAEDVTGARCIGSEPRQNSQGCKRDTNLQVVTRARSPSSVLHFRLLQVRVCSIAAERCCASDQVGDEVGG